MPSIYIAAGGFSPNVSGEYIQADPTSYLRTDGIYEIKDLAGTFAIREFGSSTDLFTSATLLGAYTATPPSTGSPEVTDAAPESDFIPAVICC